MSRYTSITTDIWKDPDFKSMKAEAKLLYVYLLTSEFSNIAGFYRLCPEDIERNVGKDALTIFLNGSKLWRYDQRTETVLIPNYLKYNTVKSAPQLKALNGAIKSLSWSELFVYWFYNMHKYCGVETFKFIDESIRKYTMTKAKLMTGKEAMVVAALLEDI